MPVDHQFQSNVNGFCYYRVFVPILRIQLCQCGQSVISSTQFMFLDITSQYPIPSWFGFLLRATYVDLGGILMDSPKMRQLNEVSFLWLNIHQSFLRTIRFDATSRKIPRMTDCVCVEIIRARQHPICSSVWQRQRIVIPSIIIHSIISFIIVCVWSILRLPQPLVILWMGYCTDVKLW